MSAQLGFFPRDEPFPEGLLFQPEFLAPDEENELLARMRSLPFQPFQFGIYEGKRRIVSYGARYDFTHQRLEKAEELPAWLLPYAQRVETFNKLSAGSIQHALLTEYDLGAGIGWHRDKKEFAEVFGLSLAAACKFRFRRKAAGRWERFTLDCAPRSLYAIRGEARSAWEHSIPPVEEQRYSITFRTMAAPGA